MGKMKERTTGPNEEEQIPNAAKEKPTIEENTVPAECKDCNKYVDEGIPVYKMCKVVSF